MIFGWQHQFNFILSEPFLKYRWWWLISIQSLSMIQKDFSFGSDLRGMIAWIKNGLKSCPEKIKWIRMFAITWCDLSKRPNKWTEAFIGDKNHDKNFVARAYLRKIMQDKIMISIRALNPLPAGTIFVSNVAMMKTRPSSIAIKNEIFSPDFTGIKIAIIDTQPRISIGNTIVNVVCLYFRCGINNTTCWPKIAIYRHICLRTQVSMTWTPCPSNSV